MKLPALWIALSLACGIVVAAAAGASSLPKMKLLFAIALGAYSVAVLVSVRRSAHRVDLFPRTLAPPGNPGCDPRTKRHTARECWPANEHGQLDSADPLRWRGVLREDPRRIFLGSPLRNRTDRR